MSRDTRREALLEAARQVVFRFGYRKTSLDAVATEAGVSRATIYNYFPNKDALLRSIIVHELEGLRAAMMEAVDQEQAPDEQLRAWLHTRYERLGHLKRLYAAFMTIAKELIPVANLEFEAFQDEQRVVIQGILDTGIEQGLFRPVDTETLGKALWSALRGLDEGFVFEDRDELAQAADLLIDTLLRGLYQ